MDLVSRDEKLNEFRRATLALAIALSASTAVSAAAEQKKQPASTTALQDHFVQAPSTPPTPPPETPVPAIAPQQRSMTVKIEPIGSLKLQGNDGPASWTYLIPLGGPIFAFLTLWITLNFTKRNTEATIWQKANETELKDIMAKLDGFYGPFMQMSLANKLLAQSFRSRQSNAQTFRLLIAVFDRSWFNSLKPGDKMVVHEICENATTLEKFISERAGLVDSQILPYLARASAHFRILHLAHTGELGDDPTNFERFVYPKQLDHVLELEVARLRSRCATLRATPGSRPELIEPLVLGSDLDLPPWPGEDLQQGPPDHRGRFAAN